MGMESNRGAVRARIEGHAGRRTRARRCARADGAGNVGPRDQEGLPPASQAYENLIDIADKVSLTDAVELLEQNLQEEEIALNKLKAIASGFNVAEESESEITM